MIVMRAAPDVTACFSTRPPATVKSIAGAVRSKFCGPLFLSAGPGGFRHLLGQVRAVDCMDFLQLVLTGEIENHAASFAR